MKTDLLNRRLRSAPPNPLVRRLVLTATDHLIFEAINRHGPLPTHYLYEFTKHLRKDYTHLQKRLTEFYNGDRLGPLLVRPPQQFAGFQARYQHLVYDLAPRALQALTQGGALAGSPTKRTDPFLHRLMGACVAASIQIVAPTKGLRYIPRDEILNHHRCPEATRLSNNPMAISLSGLGDAKALVPDDLFGLEYPGVGFRFFAVEIDRNTESIERKSLEQNSFGRKVLGYLDVLRHQTFRARWGIPNLHILTVTTNATHARNILEFIRAHSEFAYAERFGVSCEPVFGANWHVPTAPLWRLLGDAWSAPAGPKDIGRA